MAYIIERKHRFYVVAYDGIDPLTGRERRRWHPAGSSRTDAEAIAATLERTASPVVPIAGTPATLAQFLSEQWMPRRRTRLGQTTAHRYGWMIDNYINPRTGAIALRSLRVEHLDGMRRGELAGLRWGDWNRATHRVSIARSRQVVGGRSIEVPVKTRTSRRCIDLDPGTEQVLERWRRSQRRDGHPVELSDPIFSNHHGKPVHAESISQLFDRHLARTDVPRIRFHDLRHTHASLLVAAGTPIKVVSERLGHAHPGFTMATYQHLVPGMSATAATDFANLIRTHRDDDLDQAGAFR